MAADQAAGLRRRQADRPARCIHLLASTTDPAHRLAQALSRHGRTSLLVDTQGRLFGEGPRNLFDWRQQLARQQFNTVALPGGDGWHAPGAQADVQALAWLATRYDCLLFDVSLDSPGWQAVPQAGHTVVLHAAQASAQQAYALLKTLAHHGCGADIVLLGEPAVVTQLQAASRRFLDSGFAQKMGNLSNEHDAFAALAVRMSGEETGRKAVV